MSGRERGPVRLIRRNFARTGSRCARLDLPTWGQISGQGLRGDGPGVSCGRGHRRTREQDTVWWYASYSGDANPLTFCASATDTSAELLERVVHKPRPLIESITAHPRQAAPRCARPTRPSRRRRLSSKRACNIRVGPLELAPPIETLERATVEAPLSSQSKGAVDLGCTRPMPQLPIRVNPPRCSAWTLSGTPAPACARSVSTTASLGVPKTWICVVESSVSA
jgi:hypothetical protein